MRTSSTCTVASAARTYSSSRTVPPSQRNPAASPVHSNA